MVRLNNIHYRTHATETDPMTDTSPDFDTFTTGIVREQLGSDDLDGALERLPDWRRDTTGGTACLAATFSFDDFNACMAFSHRVADLADEYDHHPELVIRYGSVTVRWWTHTAGGIASNDVFMATRTTALVA